VSERICIHCDEPCSDDDFCYGCGFCICSDCDEGTAPMGKHDREDHLGEPIDE
jgi:hypothetical protein